jgi:hypothetical protein
MRTPGHIENDVLFGHDGYLFLASGAHKVMETVSGQLPVGPDSLAAFGANMAARAKMLRRRNTVFLHVIVPDKQSIVPELWPFPAPLIVGERFVEAAGECASHICMPLAELRTAGTEALTKTDTHLSDFGFILLACRIVERLTGTSQAAELERLRAACNRLRHTQGDLAIKLNPKISEDETIYSGEIPGEVFTNKLQRNNGIIDLRFNPNAPFPKRLVFIGDSFGRSISRYLQLFFREVYFFRSPYLHPELAVQTGADFVVTNCVERYLRATRPDSARPFFFAYPHVSGEPYTISAEFADALSAIMSFPRQPYRAFARRLGLSDRPARRTGAAGHGPERGRSEQRAGKKGTGA